METCLEVDTGFVQVYTGDGKGKTTAALGLALRAAEQGGTCSSASLSRASGTANTLRLERLADRVTVRQFGRGCFIKRSPDRADSHQLAQEGLARVQGIILAGKHRLVVLDEASVAVALGIFPVRGVAGIYQPSLRSDRVGNHRVGGASSRVVQAADLVTEMREVKHYYRRA